MPVSPIDISDHSVDLEAELAKATGLLRDGGLIVLPTETVYGIAGRLDHPDARAKIAKLRGGAVGPLTPHLHDAKQADDFIGPVGSFGRRLMHKVWPGPVALTFGVDAERRQQVAKHFEIAENDLYDNGQIVLRCPDHPLTTAIMELAGVPLVFTRAGLSGDSTRPPTSGDIPDEVEMAFAAGLTRFTKPSTVLKVGEEDFEIVRQGVYDRRIIERMLRTTVLFVCSGNTCRSPMAKALAAKVLAEELGTTPDKLGERGVEVISAGSFAVPGVRATPQAADAVAGMGADLTSHRSQPLSVELIHRADAIFTMSRAHAEAVAGMVPSSQSKLMPLDPEGDIEDPIGGDASLYRKLAGNIEDLLRRRLPEVLGETLEVLKRPAGPTAGG